MNRSLKKNLSQIVPALLALMLIILWASGRDWHSNAWHTEQRMNRFGTMDELEYAFRDFSEAHAGATAPTIEEAIAASKIFLQPEEIVRDEQTNRNLKRAVLFHNLEAHPVRRPASTYEWLAIVYVPERSLPEPYRVDEDCVYWIGAPADGPQKGIAESYLSTLTEAKSIFTPEVIAAAKRKFDEDARVASTQLQH